MRKHAGKLSVILAAFLTAPLLLSVSNSSSTSEEGRDPETELAAARESLDHILRRLEASRQESRRPGLGPQTAFADRAFYNAKEFFEHREWLSTVRELNTFLNLTQVPETKTYLDAQWMLGHSYESIGYPTKALRAYFRYLAHYLTASVKDASHDRLLDVLRRMLPIAAKDESSNHQLNELLASVTTLDLPEAVRPAVYFAAAKAAAHDGNVQIATRFLDDPKAQAKDDTLKAKGLYLRALIALNHREFEKAEDLLADAIQEDEEDGETESLARLALARLAVRQKHRETALEYYDAIDDESPAFRDALFESVYVHLDLKQDGDARTKAMQFIARHPDDPSSFQLRTLLAYLDLRAGDVASARSSIAGADTHLAKISGFLGAKLSTRTKLDQSTLIELNALSNAQIKPTPTVAEGLAQFAKLGEISRRLADARGELRNLSFTIGRVQIDAFRPQWVNRAEQLARLGDEALEVGHRLAAAERHLYQKSLDAIDWQALTAAEERRTRLLTPQADIARRMRYWPTYASLVDLDRDAAEGDAKLKRARAELAAARLRLAQSGNAAASQRIAELESGAAKISETIARNVEQIRKKRVAALLDQAPHRAARKFLTQYAVSLHEESELIKKARDGARTPSERLLAQDAQSAWKRWEFVTKELFDDIDELDREIEKGLAQVLADIERQEAEHDKLREGVEAITEQLESRLGLSLASIVDQYSGAVDARMSRHKKWRADLEWLEFKAQTDEGRKVDARFQLEQQILKDNLTDLEQGVLWSWPK